MFRRLRWRWAKKRLVLPGPLTRPPAVSVFQREWHTARPEDFPPNTIAYDHFADLWDTYSAWFVPQYGAFLTAAGDYYRVPIRAVLDLACGTGLVTRQVAACAATVVGLDISEPMLAQARLRTTEPHVRYECGDFRSFALGETFDAVLCGSNSINYLQTPAELGALFQCVRHHLRTGGLFAFDTLDDRFYRGMANIRTVAVVRGQALQLYSFYDPAARVCEARLVLDGATERHRRIPIEEEDVRRAAALSGLRIAEHFTASSFHWSKTPLESHIYVLRAPVAGCGITQGTSLAPG